MAIKKSGAITDKTPYVILSVSEISHLCLYVILSVSEISHNLSEKYMLFQLFGGILHCCYAALNALRKKFLNFFVFTLDLLFYLGYNFFTK